MSILWLCDQLRLNSSPLKSAHVWSPQTLLSSVWQRTPGPLELGTQVPLDRCCSYSILTSSHYQAHLNLVLQAEQPTVTNCDYKFLSLFRHSESTGHYGGDKVICTDEWGYQPSRNSYTMGLAKIPKEREEKSPREIIEPWKRVSEIRVMIEE